jgi:hypothetical protein
MTSALPSNSDIARRSRHFAFVPKPEKLKASKCFPLCSQHQTLLAAWFTGGSDTARAALVAIHESEQRWKPGEVALAHGRSQIRNMLTGLGFIRPSI